MLWSLLLLPLASGHLYNVNDAADDVLEKLRTDLRNRDIGSFPIGRIVVGGFAMDESKLGDLTTLQRVGDALLEPMKEIVNVVVNMTIKDMFLEGNNASGPGLKIYAPRITVGQSLFRLEAAAQRNIFPNRQIYRISFLELHDVTLSKSLDKWVQWEFEEICEVLNVALESFFDQNLKYFSILDENNYFLK